MRAGDGEWMGHTCSATVRCKLAFVLGHDPARAGSPCPGHGPGPHVRWRDQEQAQREGGAPGSLTLMSETAEALYAEFAQNLSPQFRSLGQKPSLLDDGVVGDDGNDSSSSSSSVGQQAFGLSRPRAVARLRSRDEEEQEQGEQGEGDGAYEGEYDDEDEYDEYDEYEEYEEEEEEEEFGDDHVGEQGALQAGDDDSATSESSTADSSPRREREHGGDSAAWGAGSKAQDLREPAAAEQARARMRAQAEAEQREQDTAAARRAPPLPTCTHAPCSASHLCLPHPHAFIALHHTDTPRAP